MAIIDIESLIKIQWDKSNLWSIEIAGQSFTGGYVPANDVQLDFFGVASEQIGSTGLEIPYTRTIPQFNMTYYDDERLSLTNFFRTWLKSIVSPDGYDVMVLESAMKEITISKIDSMHGNVDTWKFQAYPTGAIQYHGDSDGSLPVYTITFTVVGGL